MWARASGALLNDGLFLKGSSGFRDALLEPLAAIALLWLMLLLPTRLAQMAMLGASAVSGGFVSRAVSYAAGSQLRDVSRQHLPSWAGGHGSGAGQRGKETDSRLGARLRAESVLAASKAAGAGGAAVAGARLVRPARPARPARRPALHREAEPLDQPVRRAGRRSIRRAGSGGCAARGIRARTPRHRSPAPR